MSFLKELRDAATNCPQDEMKLRLRYAADEVQSSLQALSKDCTTTNMIALNGAWALATRILKNAKRIPPTNSSGGALKGTVLQERLAA